MDVSLVIKQRLAELGLDQRDLAAAVPVTDSYISQLLTRKKAPPAPARTDIYARMGAFLKLPPGELARLAEIQRREQLKKRATEPPPPLFAECRELLLRKCAPERQPELSRIFAKEPFGELERLVTQKLLEVAQGVARAGLRSEEWLRRMAESGGRGEESMRAATLEFLSTDVFNVSIENCASFLDRIIENWDMDLKSFGLEVVLNRRLASAGRKRFEFVEPPGQPALPVEPGLEQFLRDESLSGDATEEEIEFLKSLRFGTRHPAALYYYRELQNLRDPLHFTPAAPAWPSA